MQRPHLAVRSRYPAAISVWLRRRHAASSLRRLVPARSSDRALLTVVVAGLLPCLAAMPLRAQAGQASPAAPVFTAAQVEAGRATFRAQCAACHGRDLSGSEAPPLAGSGFFSTWKGQSTQYLFKYVQEMPPGGPSLSAEQYLGVVSFILQQNGAVAGAEPLSATTDVPIGSIATGERPVQ